MSLLLPCIHTGIANGYPCFVAAISCIGVCTAVIGDVAGHLGCYIYLKDTVNAIAFVALTISSMTESEILYGGRTQAESPE